MSSECVELAELAEFVELTVVSAARPSALCVVARRRHRQCIGHRRRTNRATTRHRAGLTLLEVILAIAILGGALVVIGELIRTGSRSAQNARELTIAQILAESTMNEVAAGLIPATSTSTQVLETNPDWMYSLQVDPAPNQQGLLLVTVTMHQTDPVRGREMSYSLVRWMLDPSIELGVDPTADSMETDSSGASGSSGGSATGGASGSGGGSAGGIQ